MPRYRFGEFLLSPRRRTLVRNGREQPLIPRYFDLLVYLVERRAEAVPRQEIFDRVWKDVIVSDSALSQAIRTIRRALGDDSREPRYVRTVSRHGYRFVFAGVIEEDDVDPDGNDPPAPLPEVVRREADADAFEPLLRRLTQPSSEATDEDRREAAELLHALDTAEALRRLDARPSHAAARALLRDTRWDVRHAGEVPIIGAPAPLAVATELIKLRLRRAASLTAARWAAASAAAGLAGLAGGAAGGVLLAAAPQSSASIAIAPVLAFLGTLCGAAGGAGVGAGLSVAESIARSRRTLVLVCGAAAGGALVGCAAQWLGRWSLEILVGVAADIKGCLEGSILGAAAGLGYSLSTASLDGGLAAPRGAKRLRVAAATAGACGLAAVGLSLAGRPLVGGTIHLIAEAAGGGQATLTHLAQMLGEPEFGRVTAVFISTGEGALFGAGLACGLTYRPRRSRTSH